MIYFDLQQYKNAQADFEAAVKLQPKQIESVLYEGRVRAKLGKLREAIKEYDRVLLLNPNHVVALDAKGEALLALKDYRALDANDELLNKADPQNATVHFRRGVVSAANKLVEQALRDFSQAIIRQPDLAMAYEERARIHGLRGDKSAALSDLGQAIRYGLDDPVIYALHGRLLKDRGDIREAIASYDKAIAGLPETFELILERGQLHYKLDDFAKAADDFATCLKTRPNDAGLQYNLGSACLESNQLDRALEAFSKSITLNRNDAPSYLSRGEVYLAQRDHKHAEEDFKKAFQITRDPQLQEIAGQRLAQLTAVKP
jgi:tetratricopeptide (TPR) repeat protein